MFLERSGIHEDPGRGNPGSVGSKMAEKMQF